MENKSHTPNQDTHPKLAIYIDPSILKDFKVIDTSNYYLAEESRSKAHISLKDSRLWIKFPDGEESFFPYSFKNIQTILDGLSQFNPSQNPKKSFESFLKTTQQIEKRIFSGVTIRPGENAKYLWDEIIKKVNLISTESHSLVSLLEKILDIPFLKKFESSLMIIHLKGQIKAELLGIVWRSERRRESINVKEFNSFFHSIKKSKIKSFSTELFPKINLPFNGSFLSKEITSRKYSLIALVSRHDFLTYSKEEVELFTICIDLLQPHFERLIDQEFSDKRISELRLCLKDFPLPLRIKDAVSGRCFLNDLFTSELQENDIFYNKKVKTSFSIDLYESDQLRHYAFDLFHFQRISLLGDLLNTLRHELSNPLFGLKLGSQLFSMMSIDEDNKLIMSEIEKNINRCQVIIENFSNLYQIESESRPVILKKIIDESIVLSKSESREIRKKIKYLNGTDLLSLNVPVIFVVQIIFNLIVNASQAMRDNTGPKELNLTISSSDASVFMDVLDNGPGITHDEHSLLFKPFFTTKAHGTGLGLILSRNLAIKMGGNLEYLNNNKSKGAHFRLTLPKI